MGFFRLSLELQAADLYPADKNRQSASSLWVKMTMTNIYRTFTIVSYDFAACAKVVPSVTICSATDTGASLSQDGCGHRRHLGARPSAARTRATRVCGMVMVEVAKKKKKSVCR